MKKLKKLSLKKEIEREAEALEKEVSGRKDLDHITVSEDMEEALFQKIQDYEYEKRAKVVYRKKKKSYAIIAVAAVFILVFGSVMTGVGSKSYWKVWWDRDVGDEKASVINVDDMNSQKTEDLDEVHIYKKIRSELGILPVRLVYSPEGMEIEKYELNTDLQKAMLLYKYKEQTVKYTMYMNNADSSFGEKETDKLTDEFLIISDNGVEIKVKEYEEKDKKVKRYEAEFEYAGAQYEIKGVVEKEELKRRILSILGSAVLLCGIVAGSVTNVSASGKELKQVDGSYLTTEEKSIGYTSSPDLRGVHLMDGESIISKAGISRIYAYGSTTANHDVKYIATIVYVDRYNEETGRWGQIDAWVAEDENTAYMSTARSLKVDRGYYYRVHCNHIAGNEYPYEEDASFTDGILIP